MSASERLDVVVCCHNDAALLPRLLEALANQSAGRDAFRVIVVDNGSTDDPRGVAERFKTQLDIGVVDEPILGLNRARNAGYRYARSSFVAHVDADSIPDPQWVEAIIDVTSRTGCDLCGGPYRPFYISEKPAWFEDRFIGHTWGDTPRPMQGREHPHGMNMSWKKATVERLGGFRTELGLHGRGLARGDETQLVARGRASGVPFVIQYDPPLSAAAAAFHGPARITAKDNALWVESSKGGGWLFGFPSFSSLFTRLTSVHGVVGIARYWGNLPRSHEEFVRQRLAAIPDSAVR